jgi:hypothetical protein
LHIPAINARRLRRRCTHRSGYKDGRRFVAFPTPHSSSPSSYYQMAPRRSPLSVKGKAPATPKDANPVVQRPRGRPPGSGKRDSQGRSRGGRGTGHAGEASSLAPAGEGASLSVKRLRGRPRVSRDKNPRRMCGVPAPSQDLAPDPTPSRSKREKPVMAGSCSTWDLLVRPDASDWNERLRLPERFARETLRDMPCGARLHHLEASVIGMSRPRVPRLESWC